MNALYELITLKNKEKITLIEGAIMRPLKVNRDPRGSLTEVLKTTWEDVYSPDMPFTQMYYSVTDPGVARDVDRWHFHPGGQQDRFGVIKGDIVVAMYDNREDSATKGALNLFLMGESQKDNGQYLLVIPKQVLHGYVVVSPTPATMFNFPNKLYDPQEEVRIPMTEMKLPDQTVFDWEKVKIAAAERS